MNDTTEALYEIIKVYEDIIPTEDLTKAKLQYISSLCDREWNLKRDNNHSSITNVNYYKYFSGP
jgi:hypothetical protein